MKFLLSFFLHFGVCQFFGSYEVKLDNWNSGRLYLAEFNGYFQGPFGPVCIGTGKDALTGKNGNIFGSLICQKLGFGQDSLAFIGLQEDYQNFMGFSDEITDISCIPTYVAGGAQCKEKCTKARCNFDRDCEVRNYRTDGGTCIKFQSDIFVHCYPSFGRNPISVSDSRSLQNSQSVSNPSSVILSKWTSWSDWTYCEETDFFQQRSRNCQKFAKTKGPGECSGNWLEIQPCGQCLKPIELHGNYNYENDQEMDYELYNYNSFARRRRSTPEEYRYKFCSCVISTQNSDVVLPLKKQCPDTVRPTKVNSRFLRGSFVKTRKIINRRNVWKYISMKKTQRIIYVIWTPDIFGKPTKYGNRVAGWVLIANNYTKMFSPVTADCPSENWRKTPKKLQRRISSKEMP